MSLLEAIPISRRLIDALRNGLAPGLIRRKGAAGSLPVSLYEKLEILALLAEDEEEVIRKKALSTLGALDARELEQVLSNREAPAFLLDFAARHLISERPELAPALLRNPALPENQRKWIQDKSAERTDYADRRREADLSDGQRETLLRKIGRMPVGEKINTALMGSQEERAILVRDSNKLVARAVLQSPKLSDQEIESIAMMKNVSEDVLRLIAMNRKFLRSYAVARNLVNNPKAPIDVGLPLVTRLNDRDLKELSRNKNVAEVLRGVAFKLVKQKEEANKS